MPFLDDPVYPGVNSDGENCAGLTRRDYFAATALQGLLANSQAVELHGYQEIVAMAVATAGMLEDELQRYRME